MRELVKLNQLVNEGLGLNILYSSYCENFLWNGIWVTELDGEYFDRKIRDIEFYIKDHINYTKGVEVGFLNQIKDKLQSIQLAIDSVEENLFSSFSYEIDSRYRDYPVQGPMDFLEVDPFDMEGHEFRILNIIKGYFDLEYEDLINTTQEMTVALKEGRFTGGKKMDQKEVEMVFAKAHLSFVLRLHYTSIQLLIDFIRNTFETVDKLAEDYFIENKYVDLPISNPYDLEYNLSKEEIAILFYNLMISGIVKTEGTTEFKEWANLKGYLDNANIFFKVKGKKTRLAGTKNEFNKITNDRSGFGIDEKEVNLLKHLISIFQNRIEEIKN